MTPGVEVTTGPLGQGFGNSVGMAIAEAYLAARYNRPGFEIINHSTYAIVSDGDLMEGVASESASIAGHLKLAKLIMLYDDNHITLSAATSLTFSEDRAKRFEAYGWYTQAVGDGNDVEAIQRALQSARDQKDRPSLILVRTHLGYGSPHKQDTYEAHGSPLGSDEVLATKRNLAWPIDPPFSVPDQALAHFRAATGRGKRLETDWSSLFAAYGMAYPKLAAELESLMKGELPAGWDAGLPRFSADSKGLATRVASGKIMAAIAPHLPNFVGGSADLDPSTHTALAGLADFENPARKEGDIQGSTGGGWSYDGRNLHFGVREHGMGAIVNGMAAHGGTIPYASTFLIFSDYMRPSIRLAALMELHVIYVFTHDYIALGEDGSTHQPVEQLLGLRSIPGLILIRPADANETVAAWRIAIERRDRPVALALSRQSLPVMDLDLYPAVPSGVRRGGYMLLEAANGARPDIVLLASGSEVPLVRAASEELSRRGVGARVVSFPSWQLFEEQPPEYRSTVLPAGIPVLAVEAGSPLGWKPYIGHGVEVIGVDRYGASAPGEVVLKEFGFTPENVCRRAIEMLRH
jgi:transketolase